MRRIAASFTEEKFHASSHIWQRWAYPAGSNRDGTFRPSLRDLGVPFSALQLDNQELENQLVQAHLTLIEFVKSQEEAQAAAREEAVEHAAWERERAEHLAREEEERLRYLRQEEEIERLLRGPEPESD